MIELKDGKGSRRTKDRRLIVELKDRAMNNNLLLYVKIKSKSSAFGIRGNSGRIENIFFFFSLSYGQVVELRPRSNWYMIVIKQYKENRLSSSTHHFY